MLFGNVAKRHRFRPWPTINLTAKWRHTTKSLRHESHKCLIKWVFSWKWNVIVDTGSHHLFNKHTILRSITWMKELHSVLNWHCFTIPYQRHNKTVTRLKKLLTIAFLVQVRTIWATRNTKRVINIIDTRRHYICMTWQDKRLELKGHTSCFLARNAWLCMANTDWSV